MVKFLTFSLVLVLFVGIGSKAMKLRIDDANSTDANFSKVDVKGALESSSSFGEDIFRKLLARYDTDHIFLTETTNLIKSLAADYPEMVTLQSIGQSWEQRDINMLKIDGLAYLSKYVTTRKELAKKLKLNDTDSSSGDGGKQQLADESFVQLEQETAAQASSAQKESSEQEQKGRPAIFLTGAHHARELITVQMTLYTALKMIH